MITNLLDGKPSFRQGDVREGSRVLRVPRQAPEADRSLDRLLRLAPHGQHDHEHEAGGGLRPPEHREHRRDQRLEPERRPRVHDQPPPDSRRRHLRPLQLRRNRGPRPGRQRGQVHPDLAHQRLGRQEARRREDPGPPHGAGAGAAAPADRGGERPAPARAPERVPVRQAGLRRREADAPRLGLRHGDGRDQDPGVTGRATRRNSSPPGRRTRSATGFPSTRSNVTKTPRTPAT